MSLAYPSWDLTGEECGGVVAPGLGWLGLQRDRCRLRGGIVTARLWLGSQEPSYNTGHLWTQKILPPQRGDKSIRSSTNSTRAQENTDFSYEKGGENRAQLHSGRMLRQ